MSRPVVVIPYINTQTEMTICEYVDTYSHYKQLCSDLYMNVPRISKYKYSIEKILTKYDIIFIYTNEQSIYNHIKSFIDHKIDIKFIIIGEYEYNSIYKLNELLIEKQIEAYIVSCIYFNKDDHDATTINYTNLSIVESKHIILLAITMFRTNLTYNEHSAIILDLFDSPSSYKGANVSDDRLVTHPESRNIANSIIRNTSGDILSPISLYYV